MKEFWLANGLQFAKPSTEPGVSRNRPSVRSSVAAVRRLVRSPRLLRMAATLLSAESAASVCVWMERAFFKDPGDGATHWHTDASANRINVPILTAWIPLAPTSPRNGGLRFELWQREQNSVKNGTFVPPAALSKEEELAPPSARARVVAPTMQPGDVSFHHGRTKHSASANESRELREAFTIMFAIFKRKPGGSVMCAPDPRWEGRLDVERQEQ